MILQDAERRKIVNQELIDILNKLHGASVVSVAPEVREEINTEFFVLLEKLSLHLLPYSAVSQFVYNSDSEDLIYFIDYLALVIDLKYMDLEDTKSDEYKNFLKGRKLIEHFELAQQQKDSLFQKQEDKIRSMERHTKQILDSANRVEELRITIKKLEVQNKSLQEQNKNMITNFVSILGIFASILMGAFGAIQGFTSLFANAHQLDLSVILIISSIGASSIILILFFLLNGIAKLTERSLWSTKKLNGTLLEKHPSLLITHGVLIFIALIGVALELSNVELQIAWQAIWWLFPILWILYFITSIHKKDFLFFIAWINKIFNTTESEKDKEKTALK